MNSVRMSSENLLPRTTSSGKIGPDGILFDLQADSCSPSLVFGCIPLGQSLGPHNYVSFKDILWVSSVESDETSFEIMYVERHEKKAEIRHVAVDLPVIETTKKQVAQDLLARAYGVSKVQPSVLIVLNNHGGQGNAAKLYKNEILPVLQAAHVDITYTETQYPQHAVDIGRDMDIGKFDIVACCSGDGVPHEIINGMYLRKDRVEAFSNIAVTQLPCGSGNALSLSTHGSNLPSLSAVCMLKLTKSKLDLMAVTQGTGSGATTKLSFLSQAYGVIADADIGTEHLRWMGPIRFDLGVAHKVLTKTEYPCDLFVEYGSKDDDVSGHVARHINTLKLASVEPENGGSSNVELQKASSQDLSETSRDHTLTEDSFRLKKPGMDSPPPSSWEKMPASITDHLNIFYVGNMPYMLSDAQFFPAALPDDGHMDMVVTSTATPFFTMAKILLSVDNGGHVHSEEIHHAKISAYRLVPRVKNPLAHFISVDGEVFPFEPLQVEVLPRMLTVLLQDGAFVETSMTK